jgi:GNAT superfamily N-acetyltransferase
MVLKANEISYLVVSTKHRRKGVGKTLITRAKKCKGGIAARARPDNTPIVQLLAAEGFRPPDPIQGYDPDWVVYYWEK